MFKSLTGPFSSSFNWKPVIIVSETAVKFGSGSSGLNYFVDLLLFECSRFQVKDLVPDNLMLYVCHLLVYFDQYT